MMNMREPALKLPAWRKVGTGIRPVPGEFAHYAATGV
jgi:hypothetical protein